jgi:hypothetical protein
MGIAKKKESVHKYLRNRSRRSFRQLSAYIDKFSRGQAIPTLNASVHGYIGRTFIDK